ncbi:MAG TPA: hypothetical protein VG204_04280 [Terriglobia bacterium]|nr:hypothetical protein [Terriglobia bacterium]
MKRFAESFGVVLVVLAISVLAIGNDNKAAAGSLAGTWEGVAHAPDGDEQFTMTLDQSGDDVKGSIATDGGQLEITSGSYKNNALEIECETPDAKYRVTGKLQDGQLNGEWSKTGGQNDNKGTWEAKRSEAKPAGE